jgi:hypothetical protein
MGDFFQQIYSNRKNSAFVLETIFRVKAIFTENRNQTNSTMVEVS